MSSAPTPSIAIVDYGLGNLYSVRNACAYVGLASTITSSSADILAADGVVLPGVGAYSDAMMTLRTLGLISVIQDYAAAGRPLLGICLGMQLLMSESDEFGPCEGLGIVPGRVRRFEDPVEGGRILKVPQIGWNGIHRVAASAAQSSEAAGVENDSWRGTLLQSVVDGELMYFVHSYVVSPIDPGVVLATTNYGDVNFCSSLKRANVMACQFHPERSGPAGLKIYRELAKMVGADSKEQSSEPAA